MTVGENGRVVNTELLDVGDQGVYVVRDVGFIGMALSDVRDGLKPVDRRILCEYRMVWYIYIYDRQKGQWVSSSQAASSALNDALTTEVQRLKLMAMKLNGDATNFSQLSISPQVFQLHHQQVQQSQQQNGYSSKAVHPIPLGKVMRIAQMMKNEFPNQDLSIFGIGGFETGSDAAEFILLGANIVQVKLVKFTILVNRRNGSGQGFRIAQFQDQLPSNEPGAVLPLFFHRRVLPPHLSPFVDTEAEGYVAEYADTTKRLRAAAIYVLLRLLSYHLEYLDWIL
ncbi:dihydropyrimidine dehydrogenase (NADP(+)), chloroplastic-like protein [Tanacetum coccineum]